MGSRQLGYVVNTVYPEKERVHWQLRLPADARLQGQGFCSDIGLGNAKISWVDGSKVWYEGNPRGKYYVDNTTRGSFTSMPQNQGTECLQKTKTCFIRVECPFNW